MRNPLKECLTNAPRDPLIYYEEPSEESPEESSEGSSEKSIEERSEESSEGMSEEFKTSGEAFEAAEE